MNLHALFPKKRSELDYLAMLEELYGHHGRFQGARYSRLDFLSYKIFNFKMLPNDDLGQRLSRKAVEACQAISKGTMNKAFAKDPHSFPILCNTVFFAERLTSSSGRVYWNAKSAKLELPDLYVPTQDWPVFISAVVTFASLEM